jgi:CheY-like chemotaxis protein
MGIVATNRSGEEAAAASSECGCVLLVDDEKVLRRNLAKKLRREGHEVIEADNGAVALTMLREHSVDVVVCDIRMPDMDGMALLERVREESPDLPFVLLTGAPDVSTAVRAVGAGAFQYLTKPDDLPKLGACVAKAIGAHRLAVSRRLILESAKHPITRGIDSLAPRLEAITSGTILAGRYRVGRLLGAGGMGSVYEGRRGDLGQMPVAIKVIHAFLTERKDLLARFRREAEVVAAINHPNIVKVLDFVTGPGPAFIVMELLEGRTLAKVIEQEAPLSEQRVAFIASQVLSALAVAHDVNVVHRDLKPENLLLTTVAGMGDIVKLLDFGVAKLIALPEDQRLTETGLYLGTPAYMAPEYTRGEEASTRGDIYAMGCVIYEALVGALPFSGVNYHAMLHAIQQATPVPIRSVRPDVSPALCEIVERAMARDPADRFATVGDMSAALGLQGPAPVEAGKASPFAMAPTVELDLSELSEPRGTPHQ